MQAWRNRHVGCVLLLALAGCGGGGGTAPVTAAPGGSTWHAAGIGIIRQTSAVPAASGSGNTTTDEQRVAWGGLGAGLVAMPPVPPGVPAGNAVVAGQSSLAADSNVRSVFGFNDHVLLFTTAPDVLSNSTLVSRCGLRGHLLGATQLGGLLFGRDGSDRGPLQRRVLPGAHRRRRRL